MLTDLQRVLREGDWTATVAVHDGIDIIGVWPGLHDRLLGVAFDVGSTTVAGHLCDLASGEVRASAGAMNPQIRFGEDLMSRVSYVMMNPGAEHDLTRAIRGCVNDLIADLCAQAGDDVTDVLALTVVGNPIMHHLFLGLDPTELGGAPFALATDQAVHRRAAALDLTANPGARVYLLPCIAGHVGADTAGVILSEAPYQQETVNLIVDVGTNAEIVLGNRDRLLAASSPTGPAFEGAQISCGQRAAPGAIERVRIDPATLEPRFRVIGADGWSDEPGFDASVVTGVCGSGIIEVVAEMFLAGIITTDGVIDGALADRTPRVFAEGRTFSYLLHEGTPRARHHAGRRAGDPTGEGGSVRGVPAADGSPGDRHRGPHPAGRRLRRAHRPGARDGAGAGARLRPRPGDQRRQRRRHGRTHRAVEPGGAWRDRTGRAARGEDRDRPRAAFPGALRGGDGHPPRHRPLPAAGRRGAPAGTAHRRAPVGAAAPPPRPGGHRRRHRPVRREEHDMSDTAPKGRRTGGRAGRAAARLAHTAERLPFITRQLTPYEVLSEEGVSLIEENADTILEQVGIDFKGAPDALALLKDAGADVDGERVHFPRGMCRTLVQATAPQEFDQYARNPKNTVHIGGDATVFAPCYGTPFVRDLDGGRRYGTIEDFRNIVKMSYATPYLHHSGGTVCEPVDLPVNKRHYDMVYAHMRYSDKPFMGSVTHPQRAQDTVDMARILFGADYLEDHCVVLSLINANSPLVWDSSMLGAAKAYAEANQAVIMTPFILAGAMSPATVAGAAAQTLAESLAGMAYVQLVRPGAPVVFGSFASSMSMQSGAPTFGTPEPALVLYTLAACARRLRVPFRSGGSLDGLEGVGRAGGLRVREHAAAHDAGRGQLRPARGRLARGRPDRSATRSS